jgi:hypothetical protein
MVQMMLQILTSVDHDMPQSHSGSKEPRNEAKINLMEWILFLIIWQTQGIEK